jgi:hypothetical protein
MLSTKTKGLFVEMSRFRVMVAATTSLQAPLSVEKVDQISLDKGTDKVREFILGYVAGKNVKYVNARTAVYPQTRFFIRHSVETPARLKEPGYLEETVRTQLGVDINANAVGILNASDGTSIDIARSLSVQRELLVFGAALTDLRATQDALLANGIFPERMEIGSLSVIGALMNQARFAAVKRPVMMLEVDTKSTSLFVLTADRVDLCRTIPLGFDSMLPVLSGELGVKDEQSARNMLFSNTFDFTEMGPTLLAKLIKEIRASTGFYEVQTGQSIGGLFVHLLPPSLEWVRPCMAKSLGVEPLHIDLKPWLESRGVKLADSIALEPLSAQHMMGVLSLMIDHERLAEAQPAA